MPILYVHGVGIRDQGKSGWDAVKPFLNGVVWEDIAAQLRRALAPVLNAAHPESVPIQQVFWGDLGAKPEFSHTPSDPLPDPTPLTVGELANLLAQRGCRLLPIQTWPQVIETTFAIASDTALRPSWSTLDTPQARWNALFGLTQKELTRRHPFITWPFMALLSQDLRRHMLGRVSHLRGPFEGFLPYFMGDVMNYPLHRGTPQKPGAIPQRLLEALQKVHGYKQQTGEPIVVLTHSMGGQLMYDALSAYAPAQPALQDLQVDFWAAAASQLELFASLNLFVQPTSAAGTLPPLDNLKFLWNIWSPTDLLSFQAGAAIIQAHDFPITLTEDMLKAHMAYLTSPLFYDILASKVRVEMSC